MANYSVIDDDHNGELRLLASYYRIGRSPASRVVASVPSAYGPVLAEHLSRASNFLWATIWCGGPLADRIAIRDVLRYNQSPAVLSKPLVYALAAVRRVLDETETRLAAGTLLAVREEWNAEVAAALAVLEWIERPGDEEPPVGDRLEQWLDPLTTLRMEEAPGPASPAVLLASRAQAFDDVYWRRLSRLATAFHAMHRVGAIVVAPPLGEEGERLWMWALSPAGRRGPTFSFNDAAIQPHFSVFSPTGTPLGDLVDTKSPGELLDLVALLTQTRKRVVQFPGFVPEAQCGGSTLDGAYPSPTALLSVARDGTGTRVGQALDRYYEDEALTHSDVLHLGVAAAGAVSLVAEWTDEPVPALLGELNALTNGALGIYPTSLQSFAQSAACHGGRGVTDPVLAFMDAEGADVAAHLFQVVLLGFAHHLDSLVAVEPLLAALVGQPGLRIDGEEREAAASVLSGRFVSLACALNERELDRLLASPDAVAVSASGLGGPY